MHPGDDEGAKSPPLWRNPVSMTGAVLTTMSAVAFLAFVALELFDWLDTPYAGLLGYIAVPAVLAFGLLLIPLGIWREDRRRRTGRRAWQWPIVNLSNSRTRTIVGLVALLTIVNLGIVSVASVGVVHYADSNQFCGQVCHAPMTPEFTAHKTSAHAKVMCVSCHVGPGAKGLISAKLNGTRQLYLVMTGKFSRPIAEPLDRMPEAAGTCASCHTRGRPTGELTRAISSYGDDQKSTESVATLTMLMTANHWHAQADVLVEYAAADAGRAVIPYVRARDARGTVTEYFAEGVVARPSGALHQMDCTDCHNRPAHTFAASAERAVDGLIASGGISRDVPFVRREMVTALKASYTSNSAAELGIARSLHQAFRTTDPRLAPEVERAVAGAQQLYRQNVFPEMKVTWGTYITNLGHIDAPGCFRCHDGSHTTRAGAPIRQDCELCHKIR